MDLLFHRYASPLSFLDVLLEMGAVNEGVEILLKAEQEEKLWSMYLHSYPNCSFADWKRRVTAPEKPQELTHEEVITEVEKAEKFLQSLSK